MIQIPQNIPNIYQLKPPAGQLQHIIVSTPFQLQLQEFVVCNQGSSADQFRMALCAMPNSGGMCNPTPEMYMYYDVEIPANTTFTVHMKAMTIPKDSSVLVYSANGDISFSLITLR